MFVCTSVPGSGFGDKLVCTRVTRVVTPGDFSVGKTKFSFYRHFPRALLGRLVKLRRPRFGLGRFRNIRFGVRRHGTGILTDGSRAVGMSSRTAVVFRRRIHIIYMHIIRAAYHLQRVLISRDRPCSRVFSYHGVAPVKFYKSLARHRQNRRDSAIGRFQSGRRPTVCTAVRNRFQASQREIGFQKKNEIALMADRRERFARTTPAVLFSARLTGDPVYTLRPTATVPPTPPIFDLRKCKKKTRSNDLPRSRCPAQPRTNDFH